MRKLVLIGLAQALLVLAGCGGGSGSVVTSTSNNGSGNGNGNGGSQAANAVTMTVDAGPDPSAGYDVDTPFITVTVCAPGSTTNCQVIDHVEVDTGSFGLRIISSVLSPTLASALQSELVGANPSNPIVECTQFADGFSWGPVKTANVQIGGESASNVPIQVMGDPSFENEIPAACSSTGTEEDTLATFGANAILGIGPFSDDCGGGCSNNAANGWYYACPANGTSTSCTGVAVLDSQQVTNPVALFQIDNNGEVIQMPAVAEGATGATGTLIFGIGTESNNTVGAKTILTANTSYGDVSTSYTTHGGQQQFLPYSYFDTGSNAYYFSDDSIPSKQNCSSFPGYNSQQPDSWFCPGSELNLSAANTGQNGTESTVTFSVGNAYTLFNASQSGTVFNDIGASSGSQLSACSTQSAAAANVGCAFDFGFPFFLGRTVYIAYAGASTAWGNGPYYGY